jgi:outer membrane protein assembly factor BamB
MRRVTILCLTFVVLLQCAISLAAENWPHWRGPLGTGVAPAGDYPVQFSDKDGVAWSVELPGRGTSTPAVWGDRIVVTCGIDDRDGVICYDTKGKELWRLQFGVERPGRNHHATGSNPSPVTDGEHLVVYFKSGTLVCLDLNGKEKWKTNLQEKYGKDTLWWDLGTSPVFVGGRVIVAVFQGGDSYLVAFDLKSGDVAWKQRRQYDVPRENDNSYCTPQVVSVNGKDVLVCWGADHLTGHDAATGEQLWECSGFNPDNEPNWRTIASAVASDGIAIVPFGRGEGLAGVRLDGRGDVTKSARIWEKGGKGQSTDVPTPVIRDGKVYLLTDAGHIDCLSLQTGDVFWSADLPRNRNKFYASPVLAGDTLYCAREDGAVFVGKVRDKGYQEVATNEMGERIIATPVPIRGNLLVRGEQHLFMIGKSAPAAN